MTPDTPDWWQRYIDGLYLWRGRTPSCVRLPDGSRGKGVDCWGLYVWVAREHFGYAVEDHAADYDGERETGKAQAIAAIKRNMPRWRPAEWEEGAGVLFNFDGEPLHVAIATRQRGLVLHARGPTFFPNGHHASGELRSPGIVNLLDLNLSSAWRRRFAGCYLPVGC